MFGILVSALFDVLTWLCQTVLIKFVVFVAIYLLSSALVAVVMQHLPSALNIQSNLNSLSSGVWYFLNMFRVPTGLTMIVSAALTRFCIRRIPLIG